MEGISYKVTGMTCAACQAHVEKAVSKLDGVDNVAVSLLTHSMQVSGDVSPDVVCKAVADAGYGADLMGGGAEAASSSSKSKTSELSEALVDTETPKLKRRLAYSVGVLLVLMYFTMAHNMLGAPVPAFLEHNHIGLAILQLILTMIVLVINKAFFTSGFKSLIHGAPNMDTLVAMGSSVSLAWSLYILFDMTYLVTTGTSNADLMSLYHDKLYFESAAMIPALITVGKTLESFSKGKTTNALKSLLELSPKKATVRRDGEEIQIDADDVRLDEIFIVKPGEAIPVDGTIVSGATAIDESALTGESVPVDKEAGDSVYAATINSSGYFEARATSVGGDTSFAKIIQMVSDAAASKAPIARVADKVSGVFVPTVMAIALIVFIGYIVTGTEISLALEFAISVLVIACPCALGLATPVAIMVGNGVAAKGNILFKTSEALEGASKIKVICFDKTGTITEGNPVVTDVISLGGYSDEELISLASSIEEKSEHPLAKNIVTYADSKHINKFEVRDFKALFGNGIEAFDAKTGDKLLGGSLKFINENATLSDEVTEKCNKLSEDGKTPLLFAREGKVVGIIAMADTIKPDSAEAIANIKALGVKTVMLTGDNEITASAIAKQSGVDDVIAGVLPDKKESVVSSFKEEGTVAMVGDGINDAPALVSADIGIAIGAGVDVAIDAADVVVVKSKLSDVYEAIRISKATLRNIYQNLFWAFAYNVILIPMAAGLVPGIHMNPMWAAAAMSLSSFTVCMNALRLNLFKKSKSSIEDEKVTSSQLNQKDMIDNIEGHKEENIMTKTINVDGMMCQNCERHVKNALEAIDGISSAETSHENNTAIVEMTADVSEDVIKNAISEAGYTYVSIA